MAVKVENKVVEEVTVVEEVAPVAEEVAEVVTREDILISGIAAATEVGKVARAVGASFTIARAMVWAESVALGDTPGALALRFGVNKTQPSKAMGVPVGEFLLRQGYSFEFHETTPLEQAKAVSKGEWLPKVQVVFARDGEYVLEDLTVKVRQAVKLDAECNVTEALVIGWLKASATWAEFAAARKAHLDAEAEKDRAPLRDSEARAALSEVKMPPSADLIAECQRVLALVPAAE